VFPDGGPVCWGVDNAATCCDGTTANCAPSCNSQLALGAGGDGGSEGGAPLDAAAADAAGPTGCGFVHESCCTSLPVDGGAYLRSYDDVFSQDTSHRATVSTFALDKYEVTVGRFRPFVYAWIAGWRPRGDRVGVHSHLNGGLGLVDSSSDGGAHEPGWDPAWEQNFPASTDVVAFSDVLNCYPPVSPWSATPSDSDSLPIDCVNWYWAYAFCIWDGGFLPSEAEWEYAAAGGGGSDGKRVYPWSAPPTSTTIDCTEANTLECGGTRLLRGGTFAGAPGKWGQVDLAGNVFEWTLDDYATYVSPCTDCAYFTDVKLGRSARGGSYDSPSGSAHVVKRIGDPPGGAFSGGGVRCARAAP
jgi:formylglycine-generating enzyme required for sulfatase activity